MLSFISNNGVYPMKTKILGCGNILASDEGVGIHAVRKMNRYRFPGEIKMIEIGRPGTSLLDIIMEADLVFIIDAVAGGEKPGTIFRFNSDDYSPMELFNLSIHGFNLAEAYELGMKQFPDKMPKKLILQGIEIKERAKFKTELSAPVKRAVNKLVRELKKELLSLYQVEDI